jgi:hypothetical protein
MITLCSGCKGYYTSQCEKSLEEQSKTYLCEHFKFQATTRYHTEFSFIRKLNTIRPIQETKEFPDTPSVN